MNQCKKEEILKRTIPDLDNLYTLAWHQGRHECREKFSKCGFLIIDPERKKELEQIAHEDCCDSCPYYVKAYMIGCSQDITKCEKKQLQILALELLEWFN